MARIEWAPQFTPTPPACDQVLASVQGIAPAVEQRMAAAAEQRAKAGAALERFHELMTVTLYRLTGYHLTVSCWEEGERLAKPLLSMECHD